MAGRGMETASVAILKGLAEHSLPEGSQGEAAEGSGGIFLLGFPSGTDHSSLLLQLIWENQTHPEVAMKILPSEYQ